MRAATGSRLNSQNSSNDFVVSFSLSRKILRLEIKMVDRRSFLYLVHFIIYLVHFIIYLVNFIIYPTFPFYTSICSLIEVLKYGIKSKSMWF